MAASLRNQNRPGYKTNDDWLNAALKDRSDISSVRFELARIRTCHTTLHVSLFNESPVTMKLTTGTRFQSTNNRITPCHFETYEAPEWSTSWIKRDQHWKVQFLSFTYVKLPNVIKYAWELDKKSYRAIQNQYFGEVQNYKDRSRLQIFHSIWFCGIMSRNLNGHSC